MPGEALPGDVGVLVVGALVVGVLVAGALVVGVLVAGAADDVGALVVGALVVGVLVACAADDVGVLVACAADDVVVGAGAGAAAEDGAEDRLAAAGLGVEDLAGEVTGQVAPIDASECTGRVGVTAVGTTGAVAGVAPWAAFVGAAEAGLWLTDGLAFGRLAFGRLGRALAVTVPRLGGQVPAVTECVPAVGVLPPPVVAFPGLVGMTPGAAPPDGGVPCPAVTGCVPLASVPAPARCDPLLPCGVVLVWRMASRSGWTPNMTLAMTVTAARTAARRRPPVLQPGKFPHRNRGHRTSPRQDSRAGQAQCPRQVQFFTRSTMPRKTLISHGRGGRPLMRARILSRPSGLGSTPPAASDRARRSSSIR